MNDFLHKYSKFIAIGIGALLLVAKQAGWITDEQSGHIVTLLGIFGFGYLLPSPLSKSPSEGQK